MIRTAPRRSATRRIRRLCSAGFVLMEVLLAVAIFSVAVVALANALEGGLRGITRMQREDDVRRGLQSRLAILRVLPAQPMREVEKPDANGVAYTREIEQLQLQNADGQQLDGMFLLKVKAEWGNGGPASTMESSVYAYKTP